MCSAKCHLLNVSDIMLLLEKIDQYSKCSECNSVKYPEGHMDPHPHSHTHVGELWAPLLVVVVELVDQSRGLCDLGWVGGWTLRMLWKWWHKTLGGSG